MLSFSPLLLLHLLRPLRASPAVLFLSLLASTLVQSFFVVTSQFPPASTLMSYYSIHEEYYYLSNPTRILCRGLSFIISFYSQPMARHAVYSL